MVSSPKYVIYSLKRSYWQKKNQITPKSQKVTLEIVAVTQGNVEEDQTVAARLAAVTLTIVQELPIQVAPGRGKRDRPAATHSLIVTADLVIVEKPLTRETVNPLSKIALQVRRIIKSARLSRKAKQAPRANATRPSRLPLFGFDQVRRYFQYVPSRETSR